jgi:hypothetical protein
MHRQTGNGEKRYHFIAVDPFDVNAKSLFQAARAGCSEEHNNFVI